MIDLLLEITSINSKVKRLSSVLLLKSFKNTNFQEKNRLQNFVAFPFAEIENFIHLVFLFKKLLNNYGIILKIIFMPSAKLEEDKENYCYGWAKKKTIFLVMQLK